MKLEVLIRDREYRNALVAKLSDYDNDLLVNISDGSISDKSDSLILTDIAPESVEDAVLSRLVHRTVFLTTSKENGGADTVCRRVFKYSDMGTLVSEISSAYHDWRGEGFRRDYSAKVISVCCESDSYAYDRCMTVARQIIYRRGGRVLLAGLGFINDYGRPEYTGVNSFARLLYRISSGREDAAADYTYTDSYGVSTLMLPPGQNPLAYLDEDEVMSVIKGLSACFDSIVLDIGTCFRRENLSVINSSDGIMLFEHGRRTLRLEGMISREAWERTDRIRMCGESEEVLAVDDCIKRIFGLGKDGINEN